MAGRPEQNGLFLEESAELAVFEDALDDETCLVTRRGPRRVAATLRRCVRSRGSW